PTHPKPTPCPYPTRFRSGDVSLVNTANPLTITGISETGGNVAVDNTGALKVTGTITGSNVTLTARGPNGAISEDPGGVISTAGLVRKSTGVGTTHDKPNT